MKSTHLLAYKYLVTGDLEQVSLGNLRMRATLRLKKEGSCGQHSHETHCCESSCLVASTNISKAGRGEVGKSEAEKF